MDEPQQLPKEAEEEALHSGEVKELPEEVEAKSILPVALVDEQKQQIVITPEMRREVLGKMTEFMVLLEDLTIREQNFVLALLEDPTSLFRAARKAGYTGNDNTVRVTASTVARRPKVQMAYTAGLQLREDRTMVTSARTINELAIIAYSDITDFSVDETGRIQVADGVPSYATRAIQSAEYTRIDFKDKEGQIVQTTHKAKIKLWSKTDALRMLSLWQKLFSEGGGNINAKNIVQNVWNIGDQQVTF